MSAHVKSRRAEVILVVLIIVAAVASVIGSTTNSVSLAYGLNSDVNAESTSLYCTGFSGIKGDAPASIDFFNTTSDVRKVNVKVTANRNRTRDFVFVVRAHGRFTMLSTIFPGTSYFGVSAQVQGGGVAAMVRGVRAGSSLAPCVSIGSKEWYVSGLTTRVGSEATVTMLNPTATSSVVNLTMLSPNGFAAPQVFQGVVVGPHAEVALNIGTQIVNTKDVAVKVVALRGSIVAAAVQSWSTNGSGYSVISGMVNSSTSINFPNAPTNNQVKSELSFANPANTPAHVTVHLALGLYTIAPFEFDIAAQSVMDVVISPSTRVPASGAATVHIASTQPLVATLKTQPTGGGQRLTSPAMLGTTQLLYAAGSNGVSSVSIANMGNAATTVTVDLFGRDSVVTTTSFRLDAQAARVLTGKAVSSWSGYFVVLRADQHLALGATLAAPFAGALLENGSGGR